MEHHTYWLVVTGERGTVERLLEATTYEAAVTEAHNDLEEEARWAEAEFVTRDADAGVWELYGIHDLDSRSRFDVAAWVTSKPAQ